MSSTSTDKHTRIQSPSYPIMSLDEAVAKVGKIEARYRSSTVDRLDAAKLLGYSGATGPSNMTLAALTAFGLLERVGKGEVRVTERARSILHFDSPDELTSALREAAFSPGLYRELRERFSDMAVPPEEGVVTFLNRQRFNPVAVRPAARAFLQTMRYLEKMGVTESSGHADEQPGESGSQHKREDPSPMQTAMPTQTLGSPVSATPSAGELSLNEPNLNIRAGTVRLEALLDYDGLTELENQIKALKMILKPRRDSARLDQRLPAGNEADEDDVA